MSPGSDGFDAWTVLSAPARDALKAVLQPGERLLWAGKPVARAAWADAMPAVIGNHWARVVAYAITAAMALGVLSFMLLIMVVGISNDLMKGKFSTWDLLGLPILAILLWVGWNFLLMIIFPWLSIRQARNRTYVLTDRQAVTVQQTARGVQLERKDLAEVDAPRVTRRHENGVADVIFGDFTVTHYTGDGGMDIEATYDTGFTACPDADRVVDAFATARLNRLRERA